MTRAINWTRGVLAVLLVTLVAACSSFEPIPELDGLQDDLAQAEILVTGYNRVAADIIRMGVLEIDEERQLVLIASDVMVTLDFARTAVDAYEAGDRDYNYAAGALEALLLIMSQYEFVVTALTNENMGGAR